MKLPLVHISKNNRTGNVLLGHIYHGEEIICKVIEFIEKKSVNKGRTFYSGFSSQALMDTMHIVPLGKM